MTAHRRSAAHSENEAMGATPSARAPWRLLLAAALLAAGQPSTAGAVHPLPEAPSPQVVLERALANFDVDREERIQLINHRGGSRYEREVQIWLKHEDDGYHVLGTFTQPPNVRGTSFLVLPAAPAETDRVGSNQYFVYVPALDRIRRVGGSQRGDSFFGTHLSQGDVEPHPASHYEAISVAEATSGDEPVFELEARPRFDAGYDRVVFTVARRDAAILKIVQLRDDREQPVREIRTRREWLADVDGRTLPARMEVVDGRGRGHTEIVFADRKLNPDIPSRLFSTSHLMRRGH